MTALRRTERLDAVATLLAHQAGILHRRQLYDAGWTFEQVRHEVDAGRWQQLAPAVLALQTGPLSDEQRLWLAVLHAGHGAVLSHLTACVQAGLRWTAPAVIDVLTPKGDLVAPLPGCFFHQTRRPYRLWVDGDTPIPRLRIEHAAMLAAERDRSVRRGIGLVAAVVQQGLSTPTRLTTAALQIRKLRHKRNITLALGDIAGGAQSFAEIDVGRICRDAGLPAPDRQVLRYDGSGRRRYLDCEWRLPDGRIVVLEIDGSFHMRTEHWVRDMQRERSIVVDGRIVLRCSSVEIRLEPWRIVSDLVRVGVPQRFVCDPSA
jgi:hypothetical protein